MPLHDWTNRPGWEGVHHLWLVELLRGVKPLLPAGYRVYIGPPPALALGAPFVDSGPIGNEDRSEEPATDTPEPDLELAVVSVEHSPILHVERQGRLVAAVELISPQHKDHLCARTTYTSRYLGYLLEGVNLLLIDVHRRPLDFSFSDQIARELNINRPPFPAPHAVSYRVGEAIARGKRLFACWRRPLGVGEPLSPIPLALGVRIAVMVDLEGTYVRAAADAYLS